MATEEATVTTAIAASADVLAEGHDPDRSDLNDGNDRSDLDDRTAARVLARRLVARHTGCDVDAVRLAQTCAACGGAHGRPQVVGLDVQVGWSHSAGLVAVVVSAEPCAIDVESLGRLRDRDLPLDTLHAHERAWLAAQADRTVAFAELWVRKEVLVKLGVLGLGDLADVDVTRALRGAPVRGRTLVGLDVAHHDAVAAWGR